MKKKFKKIINEPLWRSFYYAFQDRVNSEERVKCRSEFIGQKNKYKKNYNKAQKEDRGLIKPDGFFIDYHIRPSISPARLLNSVRKRPGVIPVYFLNSLLKYTTSGIPTCSAT